MFPALPSKYDFPQAEEQVLGFWKERRIFDRSLEQRAGAERFVFYEGPPTANGLPHPGHCLTRAIKDLFPRYQTMRGKRVDRKAGWDTHGLPVEVEVCKELGIHTKEEIEAFGVEEFVRRCIESVFKYVRQWEYLTERIGFWVNLDEAYVTYHQSYVESVWWGLKQLFERGLLYQGHKVVWWWAQGGTALSAGEVGEGYRTVDDPSVYVRFALLPAGAQPIHLPKALEEALVSGQRVSLLIWTTTPWTLVSNHFAAVHPDIEYAVVRDPEVGDYLVLAAPLVETIGQKTKRDLEEIGRFKGVELLGARYAPPFETYYAAMKDRTATALEGGEVHVGWRVTAADFVTLESGTGLVHEAPAFGEVDFELLQNERQRYQDLDAIPLLNAVRPDGTFSDDAPEAYHGRWVKDCDKEITRELKDRGLLYHQEQYRHEYPFCPRAEEDALIQYARQSWFVRTSLFKDQFLKNNDRINWLPDHIKEGRFGDFLRNNVDWALSRERFWGTPLPIWRCSQTGQMEAVASLTELWAKPGASDGGLWAQKKAADPELPDHLQVHKPYIDAWTYDSPFAAGAKMERITEVIDCWWDAGSMPFAQWGFPHQPGSVERVADSFPADFISEALDQTRGWFYGLLAISTLLASGELAGGGDPQLPARLPARGYPLPYRNCVVLGLMMGEDGLKMSKRKKNYREPGYIFDTYGADALRWFLFSGQTPWTSVRFQEANIRDAHREFLVRLYNVFSFFNIYANIDGFEVGPGTDPLEIPRGIGQRPVAERSELDRWLISELHHTTRDVIAALDRYENFPATQKLNDLVDALSNWYVRRSRDRFWTGEKSQDKWDAYNTLYEALVTLSQLIAPFTPFFAEEMYQNLVHAPLGASVAESVHLCDYPTPDDALVDEDLAQEMALVREIVSLGRGARTAAKLKVRQPLAKAEIILARTEYSGWLESHRGLIAEELNIKQIEFTTEADQYVTYQLRPNFKALGPKFGKQAPRIGQALQQVDAAAARRALTADNQLALEVAGKTVTLTPEEVEVRLEAKPGWSAAQGRSGVVVVSTELTPELKEEGLIRELIHHIQGARKEQDLAYEARISVTLHGPEALVDAVKRHESVIRNECLAAEIHYDESVAGTPIEVEGHQATLLVGSVN